MESFLMGKLTGHARFFTFRRSSTSISRFLTWNIQKTTQLQSIPSSLVDVLESVGAKVNASKISRHDDEYIVDVLCA